MSNNKQTSVPTVPQTVQNAEALLQRFEIERDELIAQHEERAGLRREVSFAAHSGGDPEAARMLDAMHDEAARHQSKLESIDAAISEAKHRVAIAKQHEARAFDREKAKRLRECLVAFNAAAETIDNSLELIVTAGDNMRTIVTEANRLGLSHPSHAQLDSLGGLALRSSLMMTPWSRHFERVGPMEKKTFSGLMQAWTPMIERHIASLEQTDTTEAA
jgi:hypothetical protein